MFFFRKSKMAEYRNRKKLVIWGREALGEGLSKEEMKASGS